MRPYHALEIFAASIEDVKSSVKSRKHHCFANDDIWSQYCEEECENPVLN